MTKLSIALLILMVAGLACICPGASSAVTQEPQQVLPGTIGQLVEMNGVGLTTKEVSRNGDNVAVLVTIKNTGVKELPYNPLYFSVRNAEGFEANHKIDIKQEDSLKSGKLLPGESVSGWLGFDIGGEGLMLSYRPLVIGSNTLIRVRLDN